MFALFSGDADAVQWYFARCVEVVFSQIPIAFASKYLSSVFRCGMNRMAL